MKLGIHLIALLVLTHVASAAVAEEKAPPPAPGRFGGALDARQGKVEVLGHDDFDGPPLTVECWAKLLDKRSYNILVAKDTKASGRHWELFTVAGSGHFTAYLPAYTPDHVRTKVDIVDDRWHHLAMTHDGKRIQLFIDGKLQADTAVARQRKDGVSGPLVIGGLVEGTLHCSGLIDEVHVSKTIRTFDKLPERAPQADAHSIGLWRFDEKGPKFADAAPGGRTATFSARGTGAAAEKVARPSVPTCPDRRLTIELFAAEPDVVTPVGLAVDTRNRLLVLESNTHFPPKGYSRHPTDRILVLEDRDGDGKADKPKVFADGFTAAMHLTVHPNGAVYVACRGSLVRLRDQDGDGVAEQRETLLRLETSCTYPHNGLFSCALDWNNALYVSMGENLGADYRLVGSDGSVVLGGGEGGNVFRATADGGKVEKIATGFWNPVQLHFDTFGRMFTVDNDPDARPPCRLLHLVPGGDYGYRFRNGRPGLHPFTAWNGELPGTLPMIAGTGEAPSSLLSCEHGILPDEYRGTMLVTSWGDHRVDCFRLTRRGASFRAERTPLVEGPESFRPVSLAAAPDGCIYLTDWVDKSYELHGKGRVWRLRWKDRPAPGAEPKLTSKNRQEREDEARQLLSTEKGRQLLREQVLRGTDPHTRATALGALAGAHATDNELRQTVRQDASPDVRELAVLLFPFPNDQLLEIVRTDAAPGVQAAALARLTLAADDKAGLGLVLDKLKSDDPFLLAAAREALRRSPAVLSAIEVRKLPDAAQQLGVLLALRAAGESKIVEELPVFLKGADERVQFVAVQWIGEARLKQHRAVLLESLKRPSLSSELFAATLTALALVDGANFAEAAKGGQIYLEKILADRGASVELKQQALRRLDPASKLLHTDNVRAWLASGSPGLQKEAVRALQGSNLAERFNLLASIAEDEKVPVALRAEAAAALGDDDGRRRSLLWKLAGEKHPSIRYEALRSLRGPAPSKEEAQSLAEIARLDPAAQPLVERLLHPDRPEKTPAFTDVDAWLTLLAGSADPAAGERIFFHGKSAGCSRCHRFNGRGSDIGPDLSLAARNLDRRRLAESILQPAREIAPLFTVWNVATRNGRAFTGMLVQENETGEQTYADSTGKLIRIPQREIETRELSKQSLMPDDLVRTLTVQEFRDLLAFLEGAVKKPAVPDDSRGSIFARDNLVAWCIVPFDAKQRGPKERVEMLKQLGIRKVAYDWRQQHLPTFDEEVRLYKDNGIELVGVWCPPGDPATGHVRTILDVLKRHSIRTQLWVSAGSNSVEEAVGTIRPLAEAAQKIDCQVGLYNHGGWFGDPENQLAVLAQLKQANVGIVYNFHHGHEHLKRFPDLLAKMKPHLLCINLNGMSREGEPKILPVGKGERDLEILQWIRDSGYRGPVGILGHRSELDAAQSLRENLDGLRQLLEKMDDQRALKTYR